jgi:capsular polysaccharide biosynthesis protein
MQFVRDLFLNDTPKPKRRILLSRRAAKNRRWVEEERALPELQKMGFERYEFETLSVAEQAKMFSEAEVVIMPHGGGLANCVFCSPGTHVIELFSNAYLPTFMMSLSDRLDLNYHAFVGRTKEIPGEREKDIDVPADRIIQYVRKLLGA